MWLPFTLTYGPEWQESLEALEPPERFDEHFTAMTYALKRDPVGWTEGFLADRSDLRIFRTQDVANGYEIVTFVQVSEAGHACELKWIELRELEFDEVPDEGPQGLR